MPPAKNIVRIAAVGDRHHHRPAARGSLLRELHPARPFGVFNLDTSAAGDDQRTAVPSSASMGNS